MASTARQLVARVARQSALPTLALKTCQRTIHTTYQTFADAPSSQQQGQKKNFAETLSKQFIGHVKNQRSQNKSFTEPSRFVVIEALPPTATTEDIYKLAREAFPDGDKQIVETVFCRNHEFTFIGRCVLCLSSAEDARRLIEYGHKRVLGGNTLKINYTGNDKSDCDTVMNVHRRPEMYSMTDSSNASGRSVVITGLPGGTQVDHLLGYMRSRNFFPDTSPHNVLRLKTKEQSTVAKFLVKFESESEAWRCVRAFHNTDFVLHSKEETYRLQLSVAY